MSPNLLLALIPSKWLLEIAEALTHSSAICVKTKFNSDADAELMDMTFDMDKLNLELLYCQLDIHRQRWGISWHKLAAQAKVSSTIRICMAQGREPGAEDLAKLRAWLDDWGDRWN